MKIVEGLSTHPSIERVLFPPLLDDPGHALWRRDFTGASGVFSVVLEPNSDAALAAFLEHMRLFRIGASWGGLHSLEIGRASCRERGCQNESVSVVALSVKKKKIKKII